MFGYLNASESPMSPAQSPSKSSTEEQKMLPKLVENGWTAAAILVDIAWFALSIFALVAPVLGYWLSIR